MQEHLKYYAHGKLLISGEYTILDGALALAIPTKLGQWIEIEPDKNSNQIKWTSFDVNNQIWFYCLLSENLLVLETNDEAKATRLISLLQEIIELKPSFKKELLGISVITRLEFDRHWGLGSSSTLIQLLSQWSKINPYLLLKNSFKGSGYDIACATANGPILYQLQNGKPQFTPINYHPKFSTNCYFIYLGNKQFSDKEVEKYSNLSFDRKLLSEQISDITNQLAITNSQDSFCELLEKHEQFLSETLGYEKVKDRLFNGVSGTFKSLGAWGGDFVLFVGDESEVPKIKELGFSTILRWNELLLTV